MCDFMDYIGSIIFGIFKIQMLFLQTVMCSLADSGWSRCKKDKESVTEAEVKHLFDMIDRDKSGALTMRVSRH